MEIEGLGLEPIPCPVAAPARRAGDGYNIVRWTEGGVTYWAVSDIGAGDLETFVQKFRAAPAEQ